MYASPCLKIRDVVRTKSVEYMPFLLSLVCFVNAGIWTAYSLIHKFDYYVFASNATGTFLAAFQLIVYAIYRNKSTPKIDGGGNGGEKPSEIEIQATERV
ncbi:unnamed protein product [Arabis nemorensis]|uniref:Bidirectional sugar transporter SWEET n=1 Tax=Arabis nemorensis TaxID=586526 RepID=A0A565C726_9BRAS|nr:unnamed protein product [Arabis nemorensis]